MTIDDVIRERVEALRDEVVIDESTARKFVMATIKAVGQYLIEEAGQEPGWVGEGRSWDSHYGCCGNRRIMPHTPTCPA